MVFLDIYDVSFLPISSIWQLCDVLRTVNTAATTFV